MEDLEKLDYIFNELLADSKYVTMTGLVIYYLDDKKFNLLENSLQDLKNHTGELKKFVSIAKNIFKRIKENRKVFTQDQINYLEQVEYPFDKEITALDIMLFDERLQ